MEDEKNILSYAGKVAQIEAEANWNRRWDEMRESRDEVAERRAEYERVRDEMLRASPCALCGETKIPDQQPRYWVQSYTGGQFFMGRAGFKVCGNCTDAWTEAIPPLCSNGYYPEWYDTQSMAERLRYHQVMYMANRIRRQGGHFANLDSKPEGGGDGRES